MKEGERQRQQQPLAEVGYPTTRPQQQSLRVPTGDELPLFAGTPQEARDRPFVPEARPYHQAPLPGMPDRDAPVVRPTDQSLRPALAPEGAIFPPGDTTPAQLREALAPYIDFRQLRRLAASATLSLHEALITGTAPPEVLSILDLLATLLRPLEREHIQGPQDVAGLLMVEMGALPQEQLRVVSLNTKNQLLGIHTVYQGTLTSAPIRPAEVFREPLRLNSAAIITAHNHPSGDPTPSPDDVRVTAELVAAGQLLQVELLDHVVIGQGRWVSLRERGLGFST
jgi:DNA repair protein RadC